MSRSTPRKAKAPHAPPSAAQTPSGERPAKNKGGHPSEYSEEVAHEICERIATTPRGLDFILRQDPSLPCSRTVAKWLADPANPGFVQRYLRARERQADLIFDECLEIADDASADGAKADNGKEDVHATEQVARSKLRVDTRMRMAGKLSPKKYGEKVTLAGDGENPLHVELSARDRAKALAALVAKQRDTG